MKISTTTRWLLLSGLIFAPYLIMLLAGTLWLNDRGWLLPWLILNAIVMFAGWYWAKRWSVRRTSSSPSVERVPSDPRWTPAGEAAWQEVLQISTKAADSDLPLDDFQQMSEILREILQVVARQFHPRASEPAMEIPVPYVLRIIELVAADLREAFSKHVPGAHILTLRDFQRMKQLADISQNLYFFYRLLRLGVNPIAAVLGEAREAVGDRVARQSTAEIKHWATEYAIQKLGYYAIQLYSGQVILSDVDFESFQSQQAQREEKRAGQRDAAIGAEPLRVIVLGQVKAGKSSLINALFGETRAAVDIVPRTQNVEPYVLERDGLQRAIILDTAGFATGDSRKSPFSTYRREVLDSDLVLVVCSATSAVRAPDRQLLDDLRNFFQEEPNRIPPRILVVLTHIDQLRPWQEWQPPYNLTDKTNVKAQNIAAAIQAVATDLQIPADQVIPVCLAADRIYNVDDGLVPAILHFLSAAQRTKYQRCLRQFYDEEYWRKLWQQAANSGRWLGKMIFAEKRL